MIHACKMQETDNGMRGIGDTKMKRPYTARRYTAGVGEPLVYDGDGQLQERPVTSESAREMVAAMQSWVPYLHSHQIRVVLSQWESRGGLRGEWVPACQTIYLYAGGHTERVLLHELAHVLVPVVQGSGRKHIIHGAEFKATLLRYERIWRRHNRIRARQIVTADEDEALKTQREYVITDADCQPVVPSQPRTLTTALLYAGVPSSQWQRLKAHIVPTWLQIGPLRVRMWRIIVREECHNHK